MYVYASETACEVWERKTLEETEHTPHQTQLPKKLEVSVIQGRVIDYMTLYLVSRMLMS
jgi:hypothetical protein